MTGREADVFKIRNTWGAIGAMLGLIALYLLLTNASKAATLGTSVTNLGVALGKMLQGR
jgi:uncharacterized membrane protein